MSDKVVNKLFGKGLGSAMNDILKNIVYMNYDVEQICEELKDINESVRVGLYLMALENDLDEIAIRINNANKILNEERKSKFLEYYEKGEAQRFLASLGKQDKISLMSDLGIDGSLRERANMSKEKKEYYKVINDSIFKDQELDCRDGIDRFVTYKKEA